MAERMKENTSQHEENEKTTSEQKREDMQPDATDTTKKKDGITSSFSAATSTNTDSGNDMDKTRSGKQENEDESKTIG
jgi:hypothetical protein